MGVRGIENTLLAIMRTTAELSPPDASKADRRSLLDHYRSVRTRTEELVAPLQSDDFTPQVVYFASPPKWHIAHTTWFFETFVLKASNPDYVEYNSSFGWLFNSYYNNAGDRIGRQNRGAITRPSVEEVFAFRRHVDKHLESLLESGVSEELESVVELGLNHEQQHQELLLTDFKYNLSQNLLYPSYREGGSLLESHNSSEGFLKMEEGVYEIGFEGAGFSFDNELNRHKVYLHEFEISQALVTNREFMEFMDDRGYENFNLWLDEGWTWVQENQVGAPLYWKKHNGAWHQFTLDGLRPIDPDAILGHVNFYEASAFALWAGKRLPTEFEWEAAADSLNWGERWEWTNSAYLPYPGFQTAAGALGEYNGKFMINQMVLRGASVATAPGHSRKSYRNFFHPHFRWQYSGIRLAR